MFGEKWFSLSLLLLLHEFKKWTSVPAIADIKNADVRHWCLQYYLVLYWESCGKQLVQLLPCVAVRVCFLCFLIKNEMKWNNVVTRKWSWSSTCIAVRFRSCWKSLTCSSKVSNSEEHSSTAIIRFIATHVLLTEDRRLSWGAVLSVELKFLCHELFISVVRTSFFGWLTFPDLLPNHGWQVTNFSLNYPLWVSQLNQLSLPSPQSR